MSYYQDKLSTLSDIFGTTVQLKDQILVVGEKEYPIVDDVIVLLEPDQYPPSLKASTTGDGVIDPGYAEDIQFTFGQEWKTFSEILPEHRKEFEDYFDIVDLESLEEKRVCDLGCGIGRWSHFVAPHCKEIVLVDFSDAIFVARKNLADNPNALFFMGDLTRLPFRQDAFGFGFTLGVLHHLPADALEETRRLNRFASEWLVYLYYALDNRPAYFRGLLKGVSGVRKAVSKIRAPAFRSTFTTTVTAGVYKPLILLGHVMAPVGLGDKVPLYEAYKGKSFRRLRQDVYDRFFTRIEQRVSRNDISTLNDTYGEVVVSDGLPYWHFLVRREPKANA